MSGQGLGLSCEDLGVCKPRLSVFGHGIIDQDQEFLNNKNSLISPAASHARNNHIKNANFSNMCADHIDIYNGF